MTSRPVGGVFCSCSIVLCHCSSEASLTALVFGIRVRNGSQSGSVVLHFTNQHGAVAFLDRPDLGPLEDHPVGIGVAAEASGPRQDRTQSLAFPDAVRPGMENLALHRDGRADIVPSGQLADGENVAIMQPHIGVGLARQRSAQSGLSCFLRPRSCRARPDSGSGPPVRCMRRA